MNPADCHSLPAEAGDISRTRGSNQTLSIDSESDSFNAREGTIGHKTSEPLDEDGGVRAWMTVLGAWLVLFASIGNIHSFGVYHDYYTRVLLRGFAQSQIGWMGSAQMMLPFAGGLMAGKLFDAGYFHHLVITGCTVFTVSFFILSIVKEGQYYQIFLSHGIGVGLGAGLLFTPTTSVVSLHFRRRRNLACGLALNGIHMGAVIIPIVLNNLIRRFGFPRAIRIIGYLTLACFLFGNGLMRLPKNEPSRMKSASNVDMMGLFRDPAYMVFVLASTLVSLGIYCPLIYMQLYSVHHHVETNVVFYTLAVINGSSAIGSITANYLADIYGIWTLQVPVTLLSGVSIWMMLIVKDSLSLILVSIMYGIFSGAWFSLTMGGFAWFASKPQEIGARIGIAMTIVSFGLLGSVPAQGALLTSRFLWIRPVAFSAAVLLVATVVYLVVRMLVARRITKKEVDMI